MKEREMGFKTPPVNKPDPPPTTPTLADPSVKYAGQQAGVGYSSLISTGPTGLKRKATTSKSSIMGGTASQ